MTQLQGLTLGAPAAERDAGLLDYFVQSEAYKALEHGRASVLIGNRGSGKSAIFRYIGDKERRLGTHVIEVSPDNYSYEMLKDRRKLVQTERFYCILEVRNPDTRARRACEESLRVESVP